MTVIGPTGGQAGQDRRVVGAAGPTRLPRRPLQEHQGVDAGDDREQRRPLAPGEPGAVRLVEDEAGRIHILEYEMIVIGDDWRINGVRILARPAPTV